MSVATQLEMAYLEALIQDELDNQKKILIARNYHKGEQTVFLTDRLKDFLDLHNSIVNFRFNICQVIVTALQDELHVVGFDTNESVSGEDKTKGKKQSEWAWDLWQKNRMDLVSDDAHELALRDGEAFIIVDWDKENRRPRFTLHERFISTEAGGNGTGCWALYRNNDCNQPIEAVISQWTETINIRGVDETRTRRTVYYADRVERWMYDYGWFLYGTDDEPAIVEWKDNNGKGLGVTVVHLKNAGLAPEAWEALPSQDAINKIGLDILGAADMAGFPIFKALGFTPTTDGKPLADDKSNGVEIEILGFIGTPKSKNEADIEKIEASNVNPLVETMMSIISLAAQLTGTPVSRFIMTKQVAGEETIKEQDRPLKEKAKRRRIRFGNAWEDMMVIARKLENKYGNSTMSEDVLFYTLWNHSLSLDELEKKKQLGIPEETLWSELGYSAEQIHAMKSSPEYLLKVEKAFWEAAKAAIEVVPLPIFLERMGWTKEKIDKFGTERLAAIQLEQEDTIPETKL